jgi:hypothetical protein
VFQNVPNEKHTADPPKTSNEVSVDITDDPMSSGRGIKLEDLERTAREILA